MNENMEVGSDWTLKDRKTKTEVDRCYTKLHEEDSHRCSEKEAQDRRAGRMNMLIPDREKAGKNSA